MSISPLPFQSERRDQARRTTDCAVDDLQKTFSTSHCHSCLERMADGVLLLDNETRVIYATPGSGSNPEKTRLAIGVIAKIYSLPTASCFPLCRFRQRKKSRSRTSQLAVGRRKRAEQLLLNCFQLPKPAESGFKNRPLHDYPARSQPLSFPAMAAFYQAIQLNPGRSEAVPHVCRRFDPQRLL